MPPWLLPGPPSRKLAAAGAGLSSRCPPPAEGDEEDLSDAYTDVMQQRMGTSLTYRHEDGMNYTRILEDLIVGSCLQTAEDVDTWVQAAFQHWLPAISQSPPALPFCGSAGARVLACLHTLTCSLCGAGGCLHAWVGARGACALRPACRLVEKEAVGTVLSLQVGRGEVSSVATA